MRRLRRFAGLSPADRALLIRALLWVAAIRLLLWLLPFRVWRGLLARLTPAREGSTDGDEGSIDRVAWAVQAVSRCVPAATCLTQALATRMLLGAYGCPSRVHIGVAKDGGDRFLAHAWVECQGRVVVGGPDVGRYTPLLGLDLD